MEKVEGVKGGARGRKGGEGRAGSILLVRVDLYMSGIINLEMTNHIHRLYIARLPRRLVISECIQYE